jgi:hypothetical protein
MPMNPLLQEIRSNRLLWLLVFVPAVITAERLRPEAHTLLLVLSVLAIVPLAALLSHATESVAARTGDGGGRPAQRPPGEPHRTGHRPRRFAGRAVRRGAGADGLPDLRPDALPAAAPGVTLFRGREKLGPAGLAPKTRGRQVRWGVAGRRLNHD